MAVPTFILTGQLFTLTGDTESPLAGAVLTFTSNVLRGEMMSVDNASQLIAPKPVTLDANGKINGTLGIALLANDSSLNLSAPLQWTVSASNLPTGKRIRKWVFEAPSTGETLDLRNALPVTGFAATGLTRGLKGDRGDTGIQGPPGWIEWLDGGFSASTYGGTPISDGGTAGSTYGGATIIDGAGA